MVSIRWRMVAEMLELWRLWVGGRCSSRSGTGGQDRQRDGRAVDGESKTREHEELYSKYSALDRAPVNSASERTIVLNEMTSTKPLTTSASVSATTRVLPTTVASRPMHSSQPAHCRARAGMRVLGAQLLSTYALAHWRISALISSESDERRSCTSV